MSTLVVTASLLFVSYRLYLFTRRVSPTIPTAGEESFFARLKVPAQYGMDPVGFLAKQREKHGDIFYVDLFLFKFVVFLGAEGNRTVFKAPEKTLSFWKAIMPMLGPKANADLHFPGWFYSSQTILRTGVVKQERVDAYGQDCAGIATEFFEKWCQEESIPLFQSFFEMSFAHLLTIIVGEEFRLKYGEEFAKSMSTHERDMQDPILLIMPWSLWTWCKPGRRILRNHERFDEVISVEAKDIFDHPERHKHRNDYLYFVCQNTGREFIPVLGSHVMSVLFAGNANVAMTIPWMFLHARRTPGCIDRWREEILSGEAKKPYLEACFRETGRLYTNTTNLRQVNTAEAISGHQIPYGTNVAVSPAATQRDPNIFKDPLKWNPERFLENGSYNEWFQKNHFVHFGLGQHACPGERLARVLIFDLIVKVWMEGFDMTVVGGLKEGLKGVDGVGAEAAWSEENFGTPFIRGEDVKVRVTRYHGAL